MARLGLQSRNCPGSNVRASCTIRTESKCFGHEFRESSHGLFKHKSCTQTTIKFVCRVLSLMQYQNGVAAFATDVVAKAPI